MPDPWVAVDATIRRSVKLTALPSDTARYGWIVALGEAKLLYRQGTFSPGQWVEVMGRYARHLRSYVAVGLMHVATDYCDLAHQGGCLSGRGPFTSGTLVIHDWPRHQREHARRQSEYRGRDAESDAGSDVQGDAESDVPTRARVAVAVYGQIPKTESSVPSADHFALQALAEELTQQPYALANLNGKLGEKALRQLAAHGLMATERAWRAAAEASGPLPTIGQVVLGADNRLNPIPGAPDTRAEREHAEEAEHERRKEQERKALDEPWRNEFKRMLESQP
jgi:hypothetical protein